jgi:hypothetical protein
MFVSERHPWEPRPLRTKTKRKTKTISSGDSYTLDLRTKEIEDGSGWEE